MEMMHGPTSIFLGVVIPVKAEFEMEVVFMVLSRNELETRISLPRIIVRDSFKSLPAAGKLIKEQCKRFKLISIP